PARTLTRRAAAATMALARATAGHACREVHASHRLRHHGGCDMSPANEILIGKGEGPVRLLGKYGNRHGMVAGATGTGKTVSLLVLAEGFSRMGTSVFLADVKGDVAGL